MELEIEIELDIVNCSTEKSHFNQFSRIVFPSLSLRKKKMDIFVWIMVASFGEKFVLLKKLIIFNNNND